jgi:pilus assembly protein CpaC
MRNTRLSVPAAVLVQVGAALLLVAGAAAQRTEDRVLELRVGEQETLSTQGVTNYSVGNEAIIDVKLLAGKFIVVGKSPGESSLLLIYGTDRQVSYSISVSSSQGGTKAIDSTSVPERVNVRLDLYYVEVNRSSEVQVGVNWPAALGGVENRITGTVPIEPSGPATFSMSLVQVLPTLDMLHTTGWGRFLRHATVVTTNGTQAEFDSGGEVFIASVASTGQASFQTLTFGSRITVTPNYDRKTGRVEVQVSGEFSDLFDSGADFPGKNKTTSRSTANLSLGQAFAIGGVEARSETRSKSGLPGLSQIPILGVLFGSHGTSELEKENVIVIVPTIVDTVARRTSTLLDEVLGAYAAYAGDIDETNLLKVLDVGKPKSRP